MGEKCCTKKKCDNTPKCVKEFDSKKLIAYIVTFNFWIVLFRLLLIKKEETAALSGRGPWSYIWWYTKFILFLQLQLFAIGVWYQLTVSTYNSLITCLKGLLDALKKFLGFVTPNPIMDWLNLTTFHWWLVKLWYIFVMFWYSVGLCVILGGYLFVVLFFGPYLLGYYKMN